MVRPLIVLVNLCLILLLLTGCWSKVEVNDIAIVTALGLDQRDEGKVLLSLELAIPRMLGVANQSGGSQLETKAGWVVSAEGNTVMEAYRFIQQKLPRKIVFYHSKVIVIGEKLARKGLLPVLDFFERYNQSQIRSHILFTKGNAVDILKFMPKFEKLASEIMREEAKSGINANVRLLQFMDMLMSEGDSPMAAEIQLIPAELEGSNDSKEDSESNTESLSVTGIAVFKKDKLIGWLTEMESRGVLWLTNKMQESIVTVEVPENKGGGLISSQVHTAHTKIRPWIKKGEVTIQIDSSADIAIFENSSTLDLSKPEDVAYVQDLVREDIKDRIELVTRKAQVNFKTDIFGFGRVVYRKYPKVWTETYAKDWDKLFTELDISINPHINVSQVGLINTSVPIK